MKTLPAGTSITIFLLFFGVSALDAFATRNWWRAGFWMIIGLVFLAAERLGRGVDRVERSR